MRTFARILIIMLALTIVMGMIYVAVNATTSNAPAQNQRIERGERPDFPERERGERFEGGGFRLIFGAVKNTAIISIIVALIVVPKGWLQRRRREEQINST